MDYKKAISFITNRRRDDLFEADLFFRTLLTQNPEFAKAELELRSVQLDYAKGLADKKTVDVCEKMRTNIIKKLGVENKLYPPVHCSLCNDTGRVNGEICRCVKKFIIEHNDNNIDFPLSSFANINYSFFVKEEDKLSYQTTAKNLAGIVQKDDTAKIKNINIIGNSGTGKTFLASCFAGESLAKGKTVIFITAFSFLERARKYHSCFDSERESILQPLIDCDVLIIDDLGSESMLKNITKEYLYIVVNERQIKGRTTFITSNLTMDDIAVRYGERTASRLFNKRMCYTKELMYTDIRKINLPKINEV